MKNLKALSAEVLCLILARGGSKGIPRKNIRLLAGKPLIAYSIETARESPLIGRVVVSTDDKEIAEISRRYGAEVPFLRPKELAEDLTPDLPVFQHALRWLKEKEDYVPELVVDLRPTGPLRRVSTIERAIRLMLEHPEADSLRSVIWPSQTPFKMWRMKEGYLKPLLLLEEFKEPYNMPRQILPEIFWQNGYIDIARPRVIMEEGLMSGRKILPLVIEEDYIEIDYEESFLKAEKRIEAMKEGRPVPVEPARRYPA